MDTVVDALDAPENGAAAGRRLAALAEVLVVFAAVHVSYRALKNFTALGRAEGAAGLNFSAGAVMILFTIAVLLVCRRRFAQYGLTMRGWSHGLALALTWSIPFVVLVAVAIRLSGVHFDPVHAPDARRTASATVVELAGIGLLLLLLARAQPLLRRLRPYVTLPLLLALLCIPISLALWFHRPFVNTLLTVLWLFFGAGFGEEFFFRGYIQTRLDEAFGRPWRLAGIPFGAGLLISAALFGFIHVLNTVDYFHGRYTFAWPWWFPAFVTGAFFSLLRQKTRSILPGSIIHGLTDVLARVPAMVP